MKKTGLAPTVIMILSAALPLCGCRMGGLSLPGLSLSGRSAAHDVRLLETSGEDFSALLAQEYRNLSVLEEDFMDDPATAARYAGKAVRAAKGETVPPDNPLALSVPAAQKAELARYYDMVRDALAHLHSPENAALLALAQSRFDCWLERASENRDEAELSICRDIVTRALGLLAIPEDGGLRYAVRFDAEDTILDENSMAVIEQAAAAWEDRPYWGVTLVGHAPGKGDRAQNRRLSLRRAVAVRNFLAQQGIEPDKISIVAYTDGSDDAAPGIGRLVDIKFEPSYVMKEGPLYDSLEDMDGH